MDRLSKQEDMAASMKNIPSGRYGWVKEIADAAVFLFSDAGNFVNGQTLVGECHPLTRPFSAQYFIFCSGKSKC